MNRQDIGRFSASWRGIGAKAGFFAVLTLSTATVSACQGQGDLDRNLAPATGRASAGRQFWR